MSESVAVEALEHLARVAVGVADGWIDNAETLNQGGLLARVAEPLAEAGSPEAATAVASYVALWERLQDAMGAYALDMTERLVAVGSSTRQLDHEVAVSLHRAAEQAVAGSSPTGGIGTAT